VLAPLAVRQARLRVPEVVLEIILGIVISPQVLGLGMLPTWVLEQKAANRRVIAVMRQRLVAGEQVARMYQEPGLAWLERQAEVAENLVAERQAAAGRHDG
jgi:hypothetical protein